MQSAAFEILLAIQTLLTDPVMDSVAVDNVRVDPIFPADVENGTALNIELGDEDPADRSLIGVKDRSVEIKMTAIASGANAPMSADAIICEANARLMVDESLGGLCFELAELGVNRFNQANGKRLAVIEKIYLVKYRTAENTV
jgi:hypothetical protein